MLSKKLISSCINFSKNVHRSYSVGTKPYQVISQTLWKSLGMTENFDGDIPLRKLEISYTTSSAPGGQNVNKSCSRVEIRFKVDECDWIADNIRSRFFDQHRHRISKHGFFIIRSERTRSQSLNLADCLHKLRSSIRECEDELTAQEDTKPTLEDLEMMRKKQEAIARRRIEEKRNASETKKLKRIDLSDFS